jgi:hypothetical protein
LTGLTLLIGGWEYNQGRAVTRSAGGLTMRLVLFASLALVFVAAGWGEERLLVQDSRAFSDSHELLWKSEPLTVTFADGSQGARILALQFAPIDKARPDLLQVKLLLATPVNGDPGAPSQSYLSTGGFRDVRLAEEESVRTMTITKSLDTVERPNKNTARALARTAVAFDYSLKGDSLTLKGFSKEQPTKWGQLEFTVPETTITFQVQ